MFQWTKKFNRNAKLVAVGGGTMVASSVLANYTAPAVIAAKTAGTVAYSAVVLNTLAFIGMTGGFAAVTIGAIQGCINGFTGTPEDIARKIKEEQDNLLNLSH